VLAFVNIFVESPLMDSVIRELRNLPNLQELYEVSGEYDIVSVVSAKDMDEFREILVKKIMKIKGVRSTVTDVVLYSHKASIREAESHRRQTHAKTGESR
jgi:DNA-binding Lrp family transcriptional regulator